ncbi:hypothetical protein [uncultured Brachyspira sp.]|uniref:hypothetical protein n=1 Tax=uncultured Brachyspira sp. TaxID=221953 RepID=UPI0025CEDDA0|nr:hypothetical protein [uncultured Brachyspira sp.]
MKKIILFLILSLIIISCKNDGGSIYAMEKRYKNFLNILPNDIRNDYTLNSDKYGSMYKEWINEFNIWTDNIFYTEAQREQEISAEITPDKIEYAIETLTSKDYERNLPEDLMHKVKAHTDILSLKIEELEKDSNFSNSMIKLKKDEAVENFSTKDTIFYYVWNYLITIERPRRFQ